MTARILKVEFRRSTALPLAALIGGLGAAMMYATLRGWGGRWMTAALWQREYLFILLPFGLGAGAWQARRESLSKVGELFASTARPRWRRVIPTASALGIAACVGYLAMFAAAAAQVAGVATYFTSAIALVVAIGTLAMVTAVWLGFAIGVLSPSPFTAPVLIVVGLTAFLRLLPGEGKAAPLTLMLSRPSDDFSKISPSVHIGQFVWLAALTAAALVLVGASGPQRRILAAAPTLLGLLATLTILPGEREDIAVPDQDAVALVCTQDEPMICVSKVHESTLPDVRTPARDALSVLAAKLPDGPTSAVEATVPWQDTRAQSAQPGVLPMDVEVDSRGRLAMTSGELRAQLVDGAGTRPCAYILAQPDRNVHVRHHAARTVVGAWLLGAPPPSTSGELVLKSYAALQALSADEQRSRVVAMRAAAATCDGSDLLDVLAK
ncbi:hypothetical protein FKR81_42380 [Lentzea tibetensis]|uniref:Uncharacterized protein n=1 Tax=Lentzea tibetensis TaxID=2591470 RepID=A0A563EEJ4_9PSEU|nr:hypothetical protein [Lentzea tibetensis]TWP43517.1 hypothetical protein FKR81_42380 [Lentzea tibetensis]